MDADLASLEQKLEQLLSRHAAAQSRLNSQYASAQTENRALQDAVRQIEPQADKSWDDGRDNDVDEFHQDKRPENVAEKSEGE